MFFNSQMLTSWAAREVIMTLLALAPKLSPSCRLGAVVLVTRLECQLKSEVKQILFLVKTSRMGIQEW